MDAEPRVRKFRLSFQAPVWTLNATESLDLVFKHKYGP